MFRALSILVLKSCTALAFPVRVSWALAPAQVGVSYRVVRLLDGAAAMPLGETNAASLVVEARAGDKLTVETGETLRKWTRVGTVFREVKSGETRQFFRVRFPN